MDLLSTPGRVAAACADLVTTLLRGGRAGVRAVLARGPAPAGRAAPAPGPIGTNPSRRFSSSSSRLLSGRAPGPRGGASA